MNNQPLRSRRERWRACVLTCILSTLAGVSLATSGAGDTSKGTIVANEDTRGSVELHRFAAQKLLQGVRVLGLSNCKIIATAANLDLVSWHVTTETGRFTNLIWYASDGTQLRVLFNQDGTRTVTDMQGQPIDLTGGGARLD